MDKYCCETFETYHKLNKETGFNIRNIRLNKSATKQPIIINGKKRIKGSEKPYRFFITNGYEKLSVPIPGMMISFCPFCGKNLYEFYGRDECASEIEGETFKL